jgi:hypothetical protein
VSSLSRKKCLSTHYYQTTGLIAKKQTVLESAHRGEGPIVLELILEKKRNVFFEMFWIYIFYFIFLWHFGWFGLV